MFIPAGRTYGFLFCVALILTLWLGPGGRGGVAQGPLPGDLLSQGVAAYQDGDYGTAIDRWRQALQAYPPGRDLATVALLQENLARAYQQVGQSAAAIAAWEAVAQLQQELGQPMGVGRAQTEQAQVHLSLGQHRRALALLCLPESNPQVIPTSPQGCAPDSALGLAQTTGDVLGQVAALGSLGEVYRLQGNFEPAEGSIQQGLTLASQPAYAEFEMPLRNSLGSLLTRRAEVNWRRAEAAREVGLIAMADRFAAQAQADGDRARQELATALAIAQDRQEGLRELEIQVNWLPLYRRQPDPAALATLRQRLSSLIDTLPASRQTAYGAISLAQSYRPPGEAFQCVEVAEQGPVSAALNRALAIAAAIADHRAQSFALGELGHLAACQDQLGRALTLTEQAQVAANQGLGSPDSLYLWQWQAGRIYRRLNDPKAALAAYQQAITTLEPIRTELLVANEGLQFDFRDTIEPIYRQLLDLQLAAVTPTLAAKQHRAPPQGQGGVGADTLKQALTTVDTLRLAELQNYFGSDCLISPLAEARVDLLAQGTTTALISSVIFPDRTALILTLPQAPPQLLWVPDSHQLQRQVIDFRLGLEDLATEPYDTRLAEQLYDALIRPLEPALNQSGVNTLVFIHDGFLRSVPMAALHDGTRFLIQKYAVATTPALTLTASGTNPIEASQALVLGSSEAVQVGNRRFDSLSGVRDEVASILAALPGSQALVDGEFSQDRLQQALAAKPYSILHFATHGEFSPDPQENFLITGQGEKLTFNQLDRFIRTDRRGNRPLDLVMLTACETAAGDDRATLGLAGLAVRAGARRAVASLWQAHDQTTAEIAKHFYTYLQQPGVSAAQALQRAQIDLITGKQTVLPGKWAALVLVGNWL